MKSHYLVIGAVLKSINDGLREGGEPPITVIMSSKNKEIFDQEIKDFSGDETVTFSLAQGLVLVDESCSDEEVYATLPIH
ncbi:hypothetical protein [Vibrio alginolyticus]|uniref:hypothetical protein n=1 Tax=Vibrio alginolyticus TaxID=663 RepID=UPI003F670458